MEITTIPLGPRVLQFDLKCLCLGIFANKPVAAFESLFCARPGLPDAHEALALGG